MLPIVLRIIISGAAFFLGTLAGAEFARAGQRVTRPHVEQGSNGGVRKSTRSSYMLIVSLLAGAIGSSLLSQLPDAELFGWMFAGGLVAGLFFRLASRTDNSRK